MRSLFEERDRSEVLARLRSLTPESKPLWGTMNVAQMIAHCAIPLEVATGTRTMKRSVLGRMLGWLVKGGATSPKPFKRGLPTDHRFVTDSPGNVDEERSRLIAVVDLFASRGPEPLRDAVHTFFGKLEPDRWDTLMWKHLDHHLRQFGV